MKKYFVIIFILLIYFCLTFKSPQISYFKDENNIYKLNLISSQNTKFKKIIVKSLIFNNPFLNTYYSVLDLLKLIKPIDVLYTEFDILPGADYKLYLLEENPFICNNKNFAILDQKNHNIVCSDEYADDKKFNMSITKENSELKINYNKQNNINIVCNTTDLKCKPILFKVNSSEMLTELINCKTDEVLNSYSNQQIQQELYLHINLMNAKILERIKFCLKSKNEYLTNKIQDLIDFQSKRTQSLYKISIENF